MPSPFPGMDPYLEGYLWPDVHQALAGEIRGQLVPLVDPKYAVRLAIYMLSDQVPAGEIGIAIPDVEVAPLKERRVQMLVWTAANAPGPKARATARYLLRHQDAMWRWLSDERVPLTNNLAERLLCYAVIWRKLSYGTDSLAGSRYVERLLTTVATLQLQGRDAYEYLTELMTAHLAGQPLPSLLPEPCCPNSQTRERIQRKHRATNGPVWPSAGA